MLKIPLFIFLCFYQSVFAALTQERLNQKFLEKSADRALTLTELDSVEAALFELGEQEVFNQLKRKLNIDQNYQLLPYIRVCHAKEDALGKYIRGDFRTYKRSLDAFSNEQDLVFWGGRRYPAGY